jgi:hypothetical protein
MENGVEARRQGLTHVLTRSALADGVFRGEDKKTVLDMNEVWPSHDSLKRYRMRNNPSGRRENPIERRRKEDT